MDNLEEEIENRYKKAFIYRIHGNGKTYIGSSTCSSCSHRLAKHKAQYKYYQSTQKGGKCSSFECLDDPECYIELIEKYPCKDRDELRKRERYFLELETNKVNKRLSFIDEEEKENYLKIYRESNRDYYKQKTMEWRKKQRDELKSQQKITIENKNVTINLCS